MRTHIAIYICACVIVVASRRAVNLRCTTKCNIPAAACELQFCFIFCCGYSVDSFLSRKSSTIC